eukprot:gene36087-53228_t
MLPLPLLARTLRVRMQTNWWGFARGPPAGAAPCEQCSDCAVAFPWPGCSDHDCAVEIGKQQCRARAIADCVVDGACPMDAAGYTTEPATRWVGSALDAGGFTPAGFKTSGGFGRRACPAGHVMVLCNPANCEHRRPRPCDRVAVANWECCWSASVLGRWQCRMLADRLAERVIADGVVLECAGHIQASRAMRGAVHAVAHALAVDATTTAPYSALMAATSRTPPPAPSAAPARARPKRDAPAPNNGHRAVAGRYR